MKPTKLSGEVKVKDRQELEIIFNQFVNKLFGLSGLSLQVLNYAKTSAPKFGKHVALSVEKLQEAVENKNKAVVQNALNQLIETGALVKTDFKELYTINEKTLLPEKCGSTLELDVSITLNEN